MEDTENEKEVLKVLKNNKVFDISKNLSNIKIEYSKKEIVDKNQVDHNENAIFLALPDQIHFLKIPISGVTSMITNPIIKDVYDRINLCIDNDYNESKEIGKEELDYINSCLDNILTIILSYYKK